MVKSSKVELPIGFEKKQEDARGYVYSFSIGAGEWLLIYTKKGRLRGGYARLDQAKSMFLLQGEIKVTTEHEGHSIAMIIKAPSSHLTLPAHYSMVESITDSLLVEEAVIGEVVKHPEWRDLVESTIPEGEEKGGEGIDEPAAG